MNKTSIEDINKELKIMGWSRASGLCPWLCRLSLYLGSGRKETSLVGYFIKLNVFFYRRSADYLKPSSVIGAGFIRAWTSFMFSSYKDLREEVCR